MAMTITDLRSAVAALADTFGSQELGDNVGSHMTCGEAETLALVIRSVDPDGADAFLLGHAENDDDGDVHHACTVCGELTYWHQREPEAGGEGEWILLDRNVVTDHRHQQDAGPVD